MRDEQGLRDLILSWCEEDTDNRYRDVDEMAEEFIDVIMDSENLSNFGYEPEDRDEVYEIVLEVIQEYMDDANDIYKQAEEWDGNGYNNMLEDSEWKEIFENAKDVYIDALHKREDFVVRNFEWASIPDLVWAELEENVEEQLGFINFDPMAVIDNVIVNGSYGDFDEYKDEDETDEEFIAREEDNCYQIYPEQRFIIYSL